MSAWRCCHRRRSRCLPLLPAWLLLLLLPPPAQLPVLPRLPSLGPARLQGIVEGMLFGWMGAALAGAYLLTAGLVKAVVDPFRSALDARLGPWPRAVVLATAGGAALGALGWAMPLVLTDGASSLGAVLVQSGALGSGVLAASCFCKMLAYHVSAGLPPLPPLPPPLPPPLLAALLAAPPRMLAMPPARPAGEAAAAHAWRAVPRAAPRRSAPSAAGTAACSCPCSASAP